MLSPTYTTQFKKDFKLAKKQQLNTSLLEEIIEKLINEIPLDEKYKDHPLKNNWNGHRECHILPDWLLIYKKTSTEIAFVRTGTHSELLE